MHADDELLHYVVYVSNNAIFSTSFIRFVVSYIPGGQRGLKFFSSIFYAAFSKTVGKTLPI